MGSGVAWMLLVVVCHAPSPKMVATAEPSRWRREGLKKPRAQPEIAPLKRAENVIVADRPRSSCSAGLKPVYRDQRRAESTDWMRGGSPAGAAVKLDRDDPVPITDPMSQGLVGCPAGDVRATCLPPTRPGEEPHAAPNGFGGRSGVSVSASISTPARRPSSNRSPATGGRRDGGASGPGAASRSFPNCQAGCQIVDTP